MSRIGSGNSSPERKRNWDKSWSADLKTQELALYAIIRTGKFKTLQQPSLFL
jgi:hypothetical protein